MNSSTPLPSQEAAKHLGRMVLQGIDLNPDGQRDVSLLLEAIASGRLVDWEAIDRERIEEILNELCRDWGESLEGAGYDFGRAIDAIAEAVRKRSDG